MQRFNTYALPSSSMHLGSQSVSRRQPKSNKRHAKSVKSVIRSYAALASRFRFDQDDGMGCARSMSSCPSQKHDDRTYRIHGHMDDSPSSACHVSIRQRQRRPKPAQHNHIHNHIHNHPQIHNINHNPQQSIIIHKINHVEAGAPTSSRSRAGESNTHE